MVWKAEKNGLIRQRLDLYPEIGNYVANANIEQLISLSEVGIFKFEDSMQLNQFNEDDFFESEDFIPDENLLLNKKKLNFFVYVWIFLLVQNIFFIQDKRLNKHCKWKDKDKRIIPKPEGLGEVWRDNSDLNLFETFWNKSHLFLTKKLFKPRWPFKNIIL